MKFNLTLHTSNTSPFARRVEIALRYFAIPYERVLPGNLFPPPKSLLAVNPLGLIPSLQIGGLKNVCDSGNILQYLNDFAFANGFYKSSEKVWPNRAIEAEKYWQEIEFSTFAVGLITEAVALKLEPTFGQSRDAFVNAKLNAIHSTLSWFQAQSELKIALEMFQYSQAQMDLAIALGYLSFRHPHIQWREKYSKASAFWNVFSQIPAFVATAPFDS